MARRASAAVGEEIADRRPRRSATPRSKQRDIDRDIARLDAERNATPPKKLEVRIKVSAPTAAAPALLRVTYTVRGARWVPVYDARLDTGGKDRKPALELVRRAEISQNTGEDWADTTLAVSTVRTAAGGNAPELRPLIVRYPTPVSSDRRCAAFGQACGDLSVKRRFQRRRCSTEDDLASRSRSRSGQRKAGGAAGRARGDAGGFQVVFRIPGRIAVPAGQGSKSFRIASATIAPELAVHAVPALNENAFLQASFKHAEDAPLLPGRASIYRDGVFVGRSAMAPAAKDENWVQAQPRRRRRRSRSRARWSARPKGTANILIGTSKTDEREFKTVVRNGHEFAMPVTIEDQLPVSENEDIQVEMLPVTTPPTARDLRDRRGVLEWAFDAKPGEAREIKLGWRVRWPKEKAVQFTPQGS